MSQLLESPAPTNMQSRQKRKRRPTRTPKPCSQQSNAPLSRLCSPSPYLDRSFQRKKLYFGQSNENDQEEQEASSSSEYLPDESLYFDPEDNDDDDDFHDYSHCNVQADASKRGRTQDLIDEIENLSIRSNAHSSDSKQRASTRISTSSSLQTPDLFHSKPTRKLRKKAKAGNQEEKTKESEQQTKAQALVSDEQRKRNAPKTTTVRITKSIKVFNKCHEFGALLVKPSECGSGCPLYCSSYKQEATVTKLMPLFENAEFSKEDNVENALREFEFHADIYRKGVKLYGVEESPTVAIYACVSLKHDGECTKLERTPKAYLAFVMPQLHCNLAQFGRQYRRLNEEEARLLLKTGLRFLDLLRAANMVHSDIKPENIFLDVVKDKRTKCGVKIRKFVFADFGCAAVTTEEFPYGNLTGTITMWDLDALGKKYGDENGFDAQNDLYGFLGSLFDGVYGGSIIEELLEEIDEEWEEADWADYTGLVRRCRRRIMTRGFMEERLNAMKCKDAILKTVLLQLEKPRKQRMTLKQLLLMVDIQ